MRDVFKSKRGLVFGFLVLFLTASLGCGGADKVDGGAYSNAEQLEKGIAAGVQLGLDKDKVVKILGEPGAEKKLSGDYRMLVYGETSLCFSPKDKLVLIATSDNKQKICGLKPGMGIAEAEKILGSAAISDPDDFFGYSVTYNGGANVLKLIADKPGKPIKKIWLSTFKEQQAFMRQYN